jgi:hypothetical protein
VIGKLIYNGDKKAGFMTAMKKVRTRVDSAWGSLEGRLAIISGKEAAPGMTGIRTAGGGIETSKGPSPGRSMTRDRLFNCASVSASLCLSGFASHRERGESRGLRGAKFRLILLQPVV